MGPGLIQSKPRFGRAPTLFAILLLLPLVFACGQGEHDHDEQAQPLTISEKVWVRHILVQYAGAFEAHVGIRRNRATADSLARAVHRLAVTGEHDFRALAKQYSDDASSEQGGEIAYLQPGDGPPEFMETAIGLAPGTISDVVESPYGFHIIQRRNMSRVTAQHILIRYAGAHACPDSITRTRDEALAIIERIHVQMRHPDASFPVAARDFSEDPTTAPLGGYLRSFLPGTMDPNFERAAFALEENEISDVVETPFGFHLIRRIPDRTFLVSHILITYAGVGQLVTANRSREEALQLALDAAFRAKQGEDFEELVQEFSDDKSSAKRGGKLAPMRAGVYVAEFEDAGFQLDVGEVSDVVETEFGFHVIKRHQ